jgi:hypothetical protein
LTNRQRIKEKGWKDFHLFLSPEQLEWLRREAKRSGLSMSGFVRNAIKHYHPPDKPEVINVKISMKGLVKKYMGEVK